MNNHNNHRNGKSDDAAMTRTTTTTSDRPLSWQSRIPPRAPAPVAMNNVSLASLMMRSDYHHHNTLDLLLPPPPPRPEDEQLVNRNRHLFVHPFFVVEEPQQQHRGETWLNVYHQRRFGISLLAGTGAGPEELVQQHQEALRESLSRMFQGDHSRTGGEFLLLSELDEAPAVSTMTHRQQQPPQSLVRQPQEQQEQQEQQEGLRGAPPQRRQVVTSAPSSLVFLAGQPPMRGRFPSPATTAARRGGGSGGSPALPDHNGLDDAQREFLPQ